MNIQRVCKLLICEHEQFLTWLAADGIRKLGQASGYEKVGSVSISNPR